MDNIEHSIYDDLVQELLTHRFWDLVMIDALGDLKGLTYRLIDSNHLTNMPWLAASLTRQTLPK